MLALDEVVVQVFVRIDDALQAGTVPVPRRPGPRPACADSEVLTVAVVRHLLGRRSERAWLREVREQWRHYFPQVPAQSAVNRRVRWLWGAFEWLRQACAATVPADPWQQVDTTALPVKHASRHRGPERWDGPHDLQAGYGWDASHHEWFFGFRLALRTDLDRRRVRAWGIVPAAVDERQVADALLEGAACAGLLLDRGFVGRAWAAGYRARGIAVVVTPSHAERQRLSAAARRPVAVFRNRIETSIGERTDRLELARHGAQTFWGLLTRTAATLFAHTLLRLSYV
ncbi:MAG TPA: transposase [Chloroflexota bacterium]|nr:transposase [Chloroflexota bacterium]